MTIRVQVRLKKGSFTILGIPSSETPSIDPTHSKGKMSNAGMRSVYANTEVRLHLVCGSIRVPLVLTPRSTRHHDAPLGKVSRCSSMDFLFIVERLSSNAFYMRANTVQLSIGEISCLLLKGYTRLKAPARLNAGVPVHC